MQLELILNEPQSVTLLQDIDRTQTVAVVFSEPTTHRTLQMKGRDARIITADQQDMALAARSTEAFAVEIGKLGYSKVFTNRLMSCVETGLMVVRFTPQEIYQQTPGPEAGKRLDQPQ